MIKNTFFILIIFILLSSCNFEGLKAKKYEQIGDKFFMQDNYRDAIPYYLKSLKYDLGSYSITYSLGKAYEKIEKIDSAIYYYTASIKRNNQYALAFRSRGYCYYLTKDYKSSILDYTYSIKLDSSNITAQSNLAMIYQSDGDYIKAIPQFLKTIKLAPKEYKAMVELANVYFDLEKFDSCFYWAHKAVGKIEIDKDGPHATLGLAYSAIEKYDSALYHFTKAIEYKSDYSHYYNNRGSVYIDLKKPKSAIYDLNYAIKLDSINPSSFLNRGNAFFDLGEYQKSIEDYSKAIQLSVLYSSYSPATAYYNRAIAKEIIGDNMGAEIDYNNSAFYTKKFGNQNFTNLESKFYEIKAAANTR